MAAAAPVNLARSPKTLVLLAVAALLLRMLVPTGWMPVIDSAGARLELCPAAAPTPMAMSHHHHPGQQGDHGGAHAQDCPYAALAWATTGGAAPIALVSPSPTQPPAPPVLLVGIGSGLAAPPPPSTGPPASR